jgi:hypothetical protein
MRRQPRGRAAELSKLGIVEPVLGEVPDDCTRGLGLHSEVHVERGSNCDHRSSAAGALAA